MRVVVDDETDDDDGRRRRDEDKMVDLRIRNMGNYLSSLSYQSHLNSYLDHNLFNS